LAPKWLQPTKKVAVSLGWDLATLSLLREAIKIKLVNSELKADDVLAG